MNEIIYDIERLRLLGGIDGSLKMETDNPILETANDTQARCIIVTLPDFTKEDLKLFNGMMLKALLVGENITKRATINEMRRCNIDLKFNR